MSVENEVEKMKEILEDMKSLRKVISEYGVHDSISMFINALQDHADDMSDMGLKEKAIQAANMADVLREINGDSN